MAELHAVAPERVALPRLYCDLLAGRRELQERLGGDPFDPECVLAHMNRLRERSYPREELVQRLLRYNEDLEAGEATLRNVEALKKSGAFVVCTGQQPGVLTGPLYTIYKVVSCLRLCRLLSERAPDVTFVPVFWCASEDHDLEEMASLAFPGPEGEVRRFRAPLVNDGRPAEAVPVDDTLRGLLGKLRDVLPRTDCLQEVLPLLEPAAEDTLGSWCNRILLRLFSDDGLVVLEPRLLRDLAIPIVRRELETYQESSRRLEEGAEALQALGYEPPLPTRRQVHCFYIDRGRRGRIRYYADFVILGGDRVDQRELPYHLDQHPERFSPDVALRPVVQNALLPALVYVGGPSEAAYHAQLKEFHEHFDVPAALVHPRLSLTLVDGAVVRAMTKHGLATEDLFADPAERFRHLETSLPGAPAVDALGALADDVTARLEGLEAELGQLDQGLVRIQRKIRNRVQRDLRYLHRKASAAAAEVQGTGRRQIQKVFGTSRPEGRLQERVFNIVPFLTRYGPDFVRALLQELPWQPRRHLVYFLENPPPAAAESPATEADGDAPAPAGAGAEEQPSQSRGEERD